MSPSGPANPDPACRPDRPRAATAVPGRARMPCRRAGYASSPSFGTDAVRTRVLPHDRTPLILLVTSVPMKVSRPVPSRLSRNTATTGPNTSPPPSAPHRPTAATTTGGNRLPSPSRSTGCAGTSPTPTAPSVANRATRCNARTTDRPSTRSSTPAGNHTPTGHPSARCDEGSADGHPQEERCDDDGGLGSRADSPDCAAVQRDTGARGQP